MKTLPGIEFIGQQDTFKLLVFSCLIFLASCTSVYFENPQPAGQENLKEFPKRLTGLYVDTEKGDTVASIFPDGFSLDLNEKDVKIPLSKKTILRKYKSYYFLNLKEEDDNLWTVYIVKPSGRKGLIIFELSTEEAPLEKLRAITEVKNKDTKDEGSSSWIINPSIGEMDKIISSHLLVPKQKLKK
jgi:hypothetical protein